MNDPKIPTPQDEAFRLEPLAQSTASYNTAALDLGSGFAPGNIGEAVAIVANITVLDHTTGDETYAHKLQQSSDNSTWVDAGVSVNITAVGTAVCSGLVTMRYVRRAVAMAGTTPILTSESFLNRNTRL